MSGALFLYFRTPIINKKMGKDGSPMRNLIIGTDGTWNTPDQMDRDRVVPSNVVKMVRAVDEDSSSIEQVKYYDTGVGTQGKLDQIKGGAAGHGLLGNMRDAYAWLMQNHRDNDRLFLFGFSRGAYTVRSLAGMLSLCGIPRKIFDPMQVAEMAASIYRIDDQDKREAAGAKFRDQLASVPGTVHFLGVWDTVGAMGLPTKGPLGYLTRKRHEFHNVCLGSNVTHACHALAINEQRAPFEPALWRGPRPPGNQSVVQAWFPGVHSNVGGGYVDDGLSDRCLYWMIQNAEHHGLVFNQTYIDRRIDPNWFGEMRDSLTFAYLTPLTGMPRLREIGSGALGECIHFSAVKRWSSASRPDEMPVNLRAALDKGVPVYTDTTEMNFHDPDKD
jgi:uncharacterized protein (DUF2235 family)